MKKLKTFHFSERPQAGLLKTLLEERGIPCVLRNERLSTAMGEIPFLECFPELWIVDDEDLRIARKVVEEWEKAAPGEGESWRCRGCGETVDGHLSECWNCGRPQGEDS